MTTEDEGPNMELSRRRLLVAAGIGPGTLAAAVGLIGEARAAGAQDKVAVPVAAPPVAGLHFAVRR